MEQKLGIENQSKIPYHEYSLVELKQLRFAELLAEILPPDFKSKDVVIRVIHLPENPKKRANRIIEIFKSGTDRTNTWHPSNLGLITTIGHQYEEYARDGNTTVSNIFLCLRGESFENIANNHGLLSAMTGIDPRKSNGILIYDAKTLDGVEEVNAICYKFKKPGNKAKSLLGIVSFTN